MADEEARQEFIDFGAWPVRGAEPFEGDRETLAGPRPEADENAHVAPAASSAETVDTDCAELSPDVAEANHRRCTPMAASRKASPTIGSKRS